MKIGIVGGTGNISASIVNLALAQGHEVVCINRGQHSHVADGARLIQVDRHDRPRFEQLMRAEKFAAGKIIGVKTQHWLGYPDAGKYDYFDVRADLLKYIRLLQPDFVFTADPWLTYEGHRDHIQTGLTASEAIMFAGLTKIFSSDPAVDAAYGEHEIRGIAFYYTREPNLILDIDASWGVIV